LRDGDDGNIDCCAHRALLSRSPLSRRWSNSR
jgi:hypothetical protein